MRIFPPFRTGARDWGGAFPFISALTFRLSRMLPARAASPPCATPSGRVVGPGRSCAAPVGARAKRRRGERERVACIVGIVSPRRVVTCSIAGRACSVGPSPVAGGCMVDRTDDPNDLDSGAGGVSRRGFLGSVLPAAVGVAVAKEALSAPPSRSRPRPTSPPPSRRS